MMKIKNFEKELPKGYKEVYKIDAKNKKTIGFINILSLLLFLVVIVPLLLYYRYKTGLPLILMLNAGTSRYLVLIAVYIAYIFGHEFVHGAAYWLLTRQKLTFGIALFVAFCGVPDIYVYQKPALIAVLAPLVVFGIIFSVAIIVSTTIMWKIIWVLALSVHIGGCIGDIWVACMMIFKFRDPKLLVRDTGPKQTFYNLN